MKRIASFFLSLLAILALSSCEKETVLTVDQTTISFTDAGGSQTVSLTANKPWTAKCDQSWCKVSPSGGEEASSSRITISCDANTSYDERSCTVTFTCAESTKTVSVTQATNNGLLISQTSYELTKAAQQLNIEVKANVKFSVDIDAGCNDWISYNTTKGLTTNIVVLDIAENKSYDGREGKVTIKQNGGNLSSTITIKQSQLDGLFISTPEYDLSNEKHTLTVEVSTNVEFDVTPEADWVKYVQTKGLSSKQIILEVDENDTYDQRETTVNVKQKNGSLSGTIKIKQGGQPRIFISSISFVLPSLVLVAGDTLMVEIRVFPEDATNKSIHWSTSDASIAVIDEKGKLSALKEGIVDIIAESCDGSNVSSSCTLSVVSSQNVITYTSSNNSPIYPKLPSDVTVLSNTYSNGLGRLIVKDKITKIWDSAFSGIMELESISIPSGVTNLGRGAFSTCWFLSNIEIPETVKQIGSACFEQCYALKSIVLPEGITEIEKFTFFDCEWLTTVTLPTSIRSIGLSAFAACSNLSNITIPSNVEFIDDDAFASTAIVEVSLGDHLSHLGAGVFSGCNLIRSFHGQYSSDNGRCLISNDTLLAIAPSGLSSYSVPFGVKIIGARSLSGAALYSVELPNTVTSIEQGAFYNSKLNQITIPNSVTIIKSSAFGACDGLSKIIIPDSVISIERGAFLGSGIEEITLSKNLKSLDGTFYQMWKLKTVTIPKNVESVSMDSFYQCYQLQSIYFEKGSELRRIYKGNIWSSNSLGIYNLTLIDASECKSLESIGTYSFYGLGSIEYIIGAVVPPNCEPDAFYKINESSILRVPKESVEVYRTSPGWKTFFNIQEIVQ